MINWAYHFHLALTEPKVKDCTMFPSLTRLRTYYTILLLKVNLAKQLIAMI
jgi:hypothetical protein